MQGNRDINDTRGPFAFPISADEFFDRGMLLRDYFAAHAVNGFLASGNDEGYTAAQVAVFAYQVADAMLAERRRSEKPYTPSPPEAAKT